MIVFGAVVEVVVMVVVVVVVHKACMYIALVSRIDRELTTVHQCTVYLYSVNNI